LSYKKILFRMIAIALIICIVVALYTKRVAANGPAPDAYYFRATPAPSFTGPIEQVSRAQILAYANGLDFDTDYHSSDEQRLFTKTSEGWSAGPLARISPERGLTSLDRPTLMTGRIVALIVSDGYFPKLGLTPGKNYVWFDNSTGGARAVVIPSEDQHAMTTLKISCLHEMNNWGKAPTAHFRWKDETGHAVWVPCGQHCCQAEQPKLVDSHDCCSK
jgi:hypothetical protein